MSNILNNWKERYEGRLAEVYEIVKTVEVVTSNGKMIRIEVMKNYKADGEISYPVRYWDVESAHIERSYAEENDKYQDTAILTSADSKYSWAELSDVEQSLELAISFIANRG